MAGKEVVQTRVDPEVRARLEDRARREDVPLAELVRGILGNVADAESESGRLTLKDRLMYDLLNVARDRGGGQDVPRAIRVETWDHLSDPDWRGDLRGAVLGADTVHVVGQGSTLPAAEWLADRLRGRDVHAVAESATGAAADGVDAADVVVGITLEADRDRVDAFVSDRLPGSVTTVGVGPVGSPLASGADWPVRLPRIDELTEPHAVRSFLVLIATLQVALLEADPDHGTLEARFDALDEFVYGQFDTDDERIGLEVVDGDLDVEATANGFSLALDAEVELVPERRVGLVGDSPFRAAAAALEDHGHLARDPIVAGARGYAGYGAEAAQKHAEFLAAFGCAEDLGSVRDRLVNALLSEASYLFAVLPRADEPAYDDARRALFTGEDAIENCLKFIRDPVPFPLVALSFNDPDEPGHPVEREARDRSLYGDAGVISLPAHDEFTDQLLLFAAVYLFVFALLEERWPADPDLRRALRRRTG